MTKKVSQLCKGIVLTQLNQEPSLQNDVNIQNRHSLVRDSTLSQGSYKAELEPNYLQEGSQKRYETIPLLFLSPSACQNFEHLY